MNAKIPHDQWSSLSVAEVVTLFTDAPFKWCLAGGYAVEQFLGAAIRAHSDIDVVVYRDEQLAVQGWLDGWQLYAADPKSTLRIWHDGEYLPAGIHDIWGHRIGAQAWQLQLMLVEVESDQWFSRRDARIRGKREDLIAMYHGLPCIRIEVQLMYKAKNYRPKDDLDFRASLPRMDAEAKRWLKDKLLLLYPDGHDWLDALP